jgi:hypothetical protein
MTHIQLGRTWFIYVYLYHTYDITRHNHLNHAWDPGMQLQVGIKFHGARAGYVGLRADFASGATRGRSGVMISLRAPWGLWNVVSRKEYGEFMAIP